ncbi:hypothetical protein CABS01_09156 [Colletotrichum abscissum]|uniref:uncharacterized protein n=1 Tax=Colletotrichum abscissum TaxID=1671311 RepID=UPI0027D75EBD|nr:uncharacterized protein CABS01_09156 [Colletotrichum abscissum]KAK1503767.1 hypothetical protein CABS01_09156 [Colletotrichum abscissum]KAK1706839.1 hypothetical protein BDP67DRAFT_165061 [Colletotrichum lupini]
MLVSISSLLTDHRPQSTTHPNPLGCMYFVLGSTISVAGGEYSGSRAPSRTPGLVLCSRRRAQKSPRRPCCFRPPGSTLVQAFPQLRPSQGPTLAESRSRAPHGKSLFNVSPLAGTMKGGLCFLCSLSVGRGHGQVTGTRPDNRLLLARCSRVSIAIVIPQLPCRDGPGVGDDGSDSAQWLRETAVLVLLPYGTHSLWPWSANMYAQTRYPTHLH